LSNNVSEEQPNNLEQFEKWYKSRFNVVKQLRSIIANSLKVIP